jgi:hypothetical protein
MFAEIDAVAPGNNTAPLLRDCATYKTTYDHNRASACGLDIVALISRKERRIPLSSLIRRLGGAEEVVFMGFMKACSEDEAVVFMHHGIISIHIFFPFAPSSVLIGEPFRRLRLGDSDIDLLLENVILLLHPSGISIVVRCLSNDIRIYHLDKCVFACTIKTLDTGHILFCSSGPDKDGCAATNGRHQLPAFIYVAPMERSVLRFLIPSLCFRINQHDYANSDPSKIPEVLKESSEARPAAENVFTSPSCLKSWYHNTVAQSHMLCTCCPNKSSKEVKDNGKCHNDSTGSPSALQVQPKIAVVSFQAHRFTAALLSHYFPSLCIHQLETAVRVLTCNLASFSACIGIGISVLLDEAGYRRGEFGVIARLDIFRGSVVVLDVVDMQVPITPEARILRDTALSRPRGRAQPGRVGSEHMSSSLTAAMRAQANLATLLEISEDVSRVGECMNSEDTTVLSSFSTLSKHSSDVWMEDMCHPRYPIVVYNDMMYSDGAFGP